MNERMRRAAWAMRRWTSAITFAVLLGALAGLSACSYRLAGVKPLGEPVRVVVSVNEARLVRLQGYLQEEVAIALESKLGWRVSPAGSAKIELRIEEEIIDASGKDSRGIASRWTVTCGGQVLMTSKRGNLHGPWRGTGYSSGLADEATALQQAARNAAELIAAWLENEAERWPAEAP